MPIVTVGIYSILLDIRSHSFYAARPLVSAMKSRCITEFWSNDSAPARAVLLEKLPLGTKVADAVAALSSEGFVCEQAAAATNCQLRAPSGPGFTHWIVHLLSDQNSQLANIRVEIWNIYF